MGHNSPPAVKLTSILCLCHDLRNHSHFLKTAFLRCSTPRHSAVCLTPLVDHCSETLDHIQLTTVSLQKIDTSVTKWRWFTLHNNFIFKNVWSFIGQLVLTTHYSCLNIEMLKDLQDARSGISSCGNACWASSKWWKWSNAYDLFKFSW